MSELVANCPRCKAQQMTFDLITQVHTVTRHNWQKWFETFCVCRACRKPTIFVLAQKDSNSKVSLDRNKLCDMSGAVNWAMRIEGHVSLKDEAASPPPQYLPAEIEEAFREGATAHAVNCPNAAGAMFRLCVDLATKPLLPEQDANGLNSKTRRSLGLRLQWLFEQNILPDSLSDLSSCIKDDGNDGAHDGTLTPDEADDLLDFTFILLERLYTEPERIKQAAERRKARRSPKVEESD